MDPTFIINIIVRARNEIAAVMQKAAGDVDTVTKAHERGTKAEKQHADASKATAKAVDDATKRFKTYASEIEGGTKATESSVQQLKSFQREFDRLGNRVKAGSDMSDTLYKLGRAAEKMASDVKTAQVDAARETKKAADEALKSSDAAQKSTESRIDAERRLRAELSKTVRAQRDARTDAERDAARARLSGHANDLRDLGVGEGDVRKALTKAYTDQDTDTKITARQRKIESLAGAVRKINEEVKNTPDGGSWLERLFGKDKLDSMAASINRFESQSNKAGFSAVKLAGNLRGMVIVGAIGFFQQLVGAGIALGATLVAIASSAIQAGAALGGALVAGAAEALPIIGLLGAAWGRVGAVFDALKQQQKSQQTAADDATTSADRQASAADQLANAQQGLADANRRVVEAQRELTQARFDAQRQIEDLTAAERAAELQSESAVLKQSQSQTALRRSLLSGNVDDLAGQALDVRSSTSDVFTSARDSARATFDATKARRGGVEGMPSVRAARQALADAQRGVDSAQRSLDGARRAADGAADAVGSTQKALDQLLAQLSPAERRLYDALSRVQAKYKEVFTGKGGIVEPIIDAFTRAGKAALKLLNNPQLQSAARSLSTTIAGQIDRIVTALSSPQAIQFLTEMGAQAEKNLPLFVTMLGYLAQIMMNIATAAGPALTDFLNSLSGTLKSADEATSGGGGISRLEKFFDKGVEYAKSFGKLGLAIGGLFLAIIGTSAQQGQNAIDSLTGKIQDATKWIHANSGEVSNFFSGALRAAKLVLGVVWDLTQALFNLYDEDQVEAFSRAWSRTLLPTLQDVLKVIGAISRVFLDIADTGVGSVLIRFGLGALLISKTVGPIVTLLSRLVLLLGTLSGSEGLVAGLALWLGRLKTAVVPISMVASAFLILSGNIHSVGDAIKKLTPIIGTLLGLMLARGGLGGAVSGLTGLLGKVPGLGKIIGGAGTTAEAGAAAKIWGQGGAVAAGAEVSGGSRLGAIFASDFAVAAKGFLKKAGWIGVGISAVQGIVSGFQHGDVGAGIQDFAHSITFGLVKSVKESADEAGTYLRSKLEDAVKNIKISVTPGTTGTGASSAFNASASDFDAVNQYLIAQSRAASQITSGGGGVGRGGSAAGVYNAIQATLPQLSDAQEKLKDKIGAYQKEYGDSINSFLGGFYKYSQQVKDQIQSKDFIGLDALHDQLEGFKSSAPKEFQGAVDQLIKLAQDSRIQIENAFDLQNAGKRLATSFAIGVQQGHPEKVTKAFIAQLKTLPPAAQQQGAQTAVNLARGLKERGDLSPKEFQAIKKAILAEADDLHDKAVKSAAKTATDTAKAFGALQEVVAVSLGGMVTQTSNVLTSLGFKSIKTPKDLSADANQAGKLVSFVTNTLGGLLSGSAGGGFIGMKGERGGDVIPRMLGRGEAVLNWAHQRVVEPAMRAYHGFGLNEMFKKVRGKHGQESMGGMAGGGFAADPGKNFSYGQEPKIAAALAALGRKLHVIVEGISGYRSPSYSVSVGGFANDPHTRGEAADIGVPGGFLYSKSAEAILRSVGLYRPFYPASAKEINHVQLLAGAAQTIQGITVGAANVVKAALKKISAPDIPGNGPLSQIVQGLLKKVSKAANSKIGDAADNSGGLNLGNFSGGGSESANRKLAMKMYAAAKSRLGGSFSMLDYIIMHESSYDTHAQNPTSPAYGIPQALPGSKMASAGADWHDNPATQLKWMFGYLISRYGGLPQAYAYKLAHGVYEKGGQVAGRVGQAVQATLHGNEHVWTAGEVARAGGHKAMYALRSMFGGGGQGQGSYKDGGQVSGNGLEESLKNAIIAGLTAVASRSAKGGYQESILAGNTPGSLLKEVQKAQQAISSLSNKKLNKKFTDSLSKSYQELVGDGGILDQLSDATTALTDKLANRLRKATYRVTKAGNVIKRFDDDEQNAKLTDNLERLYGSLNKQQDAISKSIDDTNKRLKDKSLTNKERAQIRGIRANLRTRLDAVNSAIADNLESTFTAVKTELEGQATKVNNRAQTKIDKLTRQQRINTIFGLNYFSTTSGTRDGSASASILNDQADALQKVADKARKKGHGGVAKTIEKQIDDLRLQAWEAIKNGIQTNIDATNTQAGRANTLLDLGDRLANLKESAGDFVGAFADRGNILAGRASTLGTQRAGLVTALQQALAGGFTDQAADLVASIQELDVEVQENTAAMVSNTVAARQAAIDNITQRGSFLGGVFGGLQNILQGLGGLSGTQDTSGILGLLGQSGTTLSQTGEGLRGQLSDGYGIDLRGMSPQQVVDKLKGVNYDSVEQGMTTEQKTQFESLIQAIIDNTGAQVDNTQSIQSLTNPTSQNFASTAWQMFRQAVFNGSGGLLPQYMNPGSLGVSAQTYTPTAATTSFVSSSQSGSASVFAPQINNQEQTVDMDAETLANRLWFKYKTGTSS